MPGRDFKLYLITDGKPGCEEQLQAALLAVPSGSIAVQLRNRSLGGAALLEIAQRLRALTAAYGAPLFINDRLDIALLANADGVHLPEQGLSPRIVRNLVGEKLLIFAAAHSQESAKNLVSGGADFIVFSPIFATPSKPDVAPVGISALTAVVTTTPAPIFALGGIDTPARAAACAKAGARIACLRGVLEAPDPKAAAVAFFVAVTSQTA